jgi:hypothetical protein
LKNRSAWTAARWTAWAEGRDLGLAGKAGGAGRRGGRISTTAVSAMSIDRSPPSSTIAPPRLRRFPKARAAREAPHVGLLIAASNN